MIISNVIPDNGGIVEGEEPGKLLLLLRDTDMRLELHTYLIIRNVIPNNGGIVELRVNAPSFKGYCHEIATAHLLDHQQCDP